MMEHIVGTAVKRILNYNGSNNNSLHSIYTDDVAGMFIMAPTKAEKSEQVQLRDEKIAVDQGGTIVESYDTKNGGKVNIIYDIEPADPLTGQETISIVMNAQKYMDDRADTSDDPYSYAMNQGAIVAIRVVVDGDGFRSDRENESDNTPDAAIYVTPKNLHEWKGEEGASLDEIITLLEDQIERFSQWAKGEVYGACVWDKNGKFVESVYGYYCIDDIKEEWQ